MKYNHPAIPPVGIKLNCVYTVGYLIDNYDIKSIKTMFAPIDCKWEDLEEKPLKKDNKKVKIEEAINEVEI